MSHSIPTGFEAAHARVCELIDRFERHARDNYLQPGYQEAEARKDFIDPFWKALGWDVDHEREHNPCEQEVKVERGVSSHGTWYRLPCKISWLRRFSGATGKSSHLN